MGTKKWDFTGCEKIEWTLVLPKVQINLNDKQRFGTPIAHIVGR
jgi:hypothetical protein